MQIRKLDTKDSNDLHRFVKFPFKLYRHCAQWVPPLISQVRAELDRDRHPFYRHSEADFFLAESEGQMLGRIAVMYNRNFNAYHRSNVAFFGYFEVVQDDEVACALLNTAFAWARSRGASSIVGPRGLIGVEGAGVLVDGFEHRATMGTHYNFPYYDALLKRAGLEKDRDFYSARIDCSQDLPEYFYQAAERVRKRRGLRVLSFRSRDEVRSWIPRAVEAHGRAFSRNYTYYPPTLGEVLWIANVLLRIADPRLIKLALKDNEVIGLALALPDVAAGLKQAKGRLWPLGWLQIMRERRRTFSVILPALGFLPDYQGLGGNAVLYTELAKTISSSHYRTVEFVQVDEKNHASVREINLFNVGWYKTHRLYRQTL